MNIYNSGYLELEVELALGLALELDKLEGPKESGALARARALVLPQGPTASRATAVWRSCTSRNRFTTVSISTSSVKIQSSRGPSRGTQGRYKGAV